MIERIPGWSSEIREHGTVLSPADRTLGSMFYAERVRPLRTIDVIVRELDGLLPWPLPIRSRSFEPLVTDEGEYAVLATLRDDAGCERTVGVLFGDDFYSLCVGLPRVPAANELFATQVRACVAKDAHMLGVRRRRFAYARPPGWHGLLAGAFHAVWYPLSYPNHRSSLSVYPAIPMPADASPAADMFAAIVASIDGRVEASSKPVPVVEYGLAGTWASAVVRHVDGTSLHHDLVVLQDDRYVYPVLLLAVASHHAADLEVLRDLLCTIQPIPRDLRERARGTTPAFAWMAE